MSQKISNWAHQKNKELHEALAEPDPAKKAAKLKLWREQLAKGDK